MKINTINFKSSKIYIKSRTKKIFCCFFFFSCSNERARAFVRTCVCEKHFSSFISHETLHNSKTVARTHTRAHALFPSTEVILRRSPLNYTHCLRWCRRLVRSRLRRLGTAAAAATSLRLLLLLLLLLFVAWSRRRRSVQRESFVRLDAHHLVAGGSAAGSVADGPGWTVTERTRSHAAAAATRRAVRYVHRSIAGRIAPLATVRVVLGISG